MCVEKMRIKTIDQATLPKHIFLQMFCIFLEELESHCSMSVSNLGDLFLWVTTKAKGRKKVHSSMFWIVRCPELLSASQCVITGHWNFSKAVRVRFTALAESQKKGHRLDAATVQIEMRGLKQDHRKGSGCCSQCCLSESYNQQIHTSGKYFLPVWIWQVKGISFPAHWEWSGCWDPHGSPGLGFAATASVFLTKSRSPLW